MEENIIAISAGCSGASGEGRVLVRTADSCSLSDVFLRGLAGRNLFNYLVLLQHLQNFNYEP